MVLALAIFLAVPMGLLGSSSHEVTAGTSDLRIGFLQKIDSFNPYAGFNDSSYVFYGLVYDTLMSVDNDLNPLPNLALSWFPVPLTDPEMVLHPDYPYGSVWQYNLSRNATFSDGVPFTADDVVFNINLNAGNFSSMWSYQPYSYFIKDAVKIDDYTVRVHFRDKVTNLPMAAAYAYMISIPMLPEHKLRNMTASQIAFTWDGLFRNESDPVVGTGPFLATSSLPDEYLAGGPITLVRNPNCHWSLDYGKDVHFDRLLLYFYDDVTAMDDALLNGGIDTAQFPFPAFKSLEQAAPANIELFSGPKFSMYWTFLGFNMNNAGPNPSRLDHTIRQALAMATNKSFITQNLYYGLAEPATTAIPPLDSFWHYEPNATEKAEFELNISAANELLNQSGYLRPDGDPNGIRYCSNTSYAFTAGLVTEGTQLSYQIVIRHEYPEEKEIGLYLQNQWRLLGVNAYLWIVDEPAFLTAIYTYTYDTAVWYWSSDIDPNYQLFAISKRAWNGWSDNKWFNASYEQNYTLSVTTMNETTRQQYVDNCQRVHYLDCPYIILGYVNQTWAWRTDTFAGWGDWDADPGRSIDNTWTGNPLWFDLVPLAPIPEFPSVLMPVLGIMTVVALAFACRRGRHG